MDRYLKFIADIDRKSWMKILNEVGRTEVELRDERYDYVVHLVTAANGAEPFYTNSNNHARSEGVELARELDSLCQRAWIGHPYFDVVDNATGFDKKCHIVIASLLKRLGLEDKRYGENICKHKFLVNPSFDFDADFPVPHQDFYVEHAFLSTKDQSQMRVRRRTQNGVSHFNMTVRQVDPTSGQEIETRRTLSGREYDALLAQTDPQRVPIVKRRRCFLWENKYYQLDIIEKPVSNLLILEAYFADEVDVTDVTKSLPDFLPVEKEVTGNKQYSMFNIAFNRGI